jgi:uncharacterized protein YbjT (DUF2867 family)
MILVIGGRSKIGAALIEDLVGAGEAVRALVRSREASESPRPGFEPVVGDLADGASLEAAMNGVERLFLLSSPHPDAVEWHRNAIEAARGSSVELLVRSSIMGADPDSASTFHRDHGVSDQHLAESGVPHVIVRPNVFLQNVLENTVPGIDEHDTFYANAGDARLSMVDTRDVAAVAAVTLTEPGYAGQVYEVTGPEALSSKDVATRLSAVMGRTIHYDAVDDDAVRRTYLSWGLGEWLANALVELYQDYRRSGIDGYAAQATDTVPNLTGETARSLDQLLAESRAALAGN